MYRLILLLALVWAAPATAGNPTDTPAAAVISAGDTYLTSFLPPQDNYGEECGGNPEWSQPPVPNANDYCGPLEYPFVRVWNDACIVQKIAAAQLNWEATTSGAAMQVLLKCQAMYLARDNWIRQKKFCDQSSGPNSSECSLVPTMFQEYMAAIQAYESAVAVFGPLEAAADQFFLDSLLPCCDWVLAFSPEGPPSDE